MQKNTYLKLNVRIKSKQKRWPHWAVNLESCQQLAQLVTVLCERTRPRGRVQLPGPAMSRRSVLKKMKLIFEQFIFSYVHSDTL